jgi:Flp pilus assembly protein TadD
MELRMGEMLLALSRQDPHGSPAADDAVRSKCILLSIRYLRAALARNPEDAGQIQADLVQACHQRSRQLKLTSESIPVDIYNACALHAFLTVDPTSLDKWARSACMADLMDTLTQGNMLSSSNDPEQVEKTRLLMVQAQRENVYSKPVRERAIELAGPKFGLIEEAIAQLQEEKSPDSETLLLLGDLLLRKGDSVGARAAYSKVHFDHNREWELALRKALCDWVDGDLWAAMDALHQLDKDSPDPMVRSYLLLLAQELGDTRKI